MRLGPQKHITIFLFACLQFLPSSHTSAETAPIEIVPYTMRDYRRSSLNYQGFESKDTSSNTITLGFLIQGPAAKAITHVGVAHLTEARDDSGNDLVLPQSIYMRSPDIFLLNREEMWYFTKPAPVDKIKASAVFKSAPRHAQTIRSVKGTIKVAEVLSLEIPLTTLTKHIGEKLENARLRSYDLDVFVRKASFSPAEIDIEITHPKSQKFGLDGWGDVDVVDAKGRAVFRGSSRHFFSGKSVIVFDSPAGKRAPSDSKLRIWIAKDRKESEIPFEFKNIALP